MRFSLWFIFKNIYYLIQVQEMLFKNKCKCCLEGGRVRNMWDEYIRGDKREIYGKMLTDCFALPWQPPDHNDQICELCVGRLKNAVRFKEQVLATEKLLLELRKGVNKDQDHNEKSENVIDTKMEVDETTEYFDDYEEIEFLESEDFHDTVIKAIIEKQIRKPWQEEKQARKPLQEEKQVRKPLQEEKQVRKPSQEVNQIEKEIRKPLKEENQISKQNKSDKIQIKIHNTRNARKRKLDTTSDIDSKQVAQTASETSSPISNEPHDLLIGDTTITKVTADGNTEVEHEGNPKVATQHKDHDGDYKQEILEDNQEDFEAVIDGIEIIVENVAEVATTELETSETKINRPVLRQNIYDRNLERNSERVKHQDNLRTILICTNATPIRKRTDAGYMCAFCDSVFQDPADLKTHSINKHDNITKAKYMRDTVMFSFSVKLDITAFCCNLCGKNIYTLEEMLQHLKTFHNLKVHTDIKNHLIPLKFESNVLKCFMCGDVFKFFKSLFQHMSVHYRNFECEECNIFFICKGGLKNHKLRHLKGEFPCAFCAKVFDANIKKTHHEYSVHQHRRYTIPCSFCSEKFKDNVKKLMHLQQEHGVECPMYKCEECDKMFYRTRSLKRHKESSHLNIKKFHCEVCGKGFYEKKSFETHKVSHTKVKAFECEVCRRCFGVKRTLEQHRKLHYEPPAYMCEFCGRPFAQRVSWRLHMQRTHKESA